MSAKAAIEQLLREADIEINGSRPWDIQINNSNFYTRVLAGGSLALGESYMDRWWDSDSVDATIDHLVRAKLDRKYEKNLSFVLFLLRAKLLNMQSIGRSHIVGMRHYDIGNDLYSEMLDTWMQYSCGYWKDGVRNLNEAQEAKLDLIARKLYLKPGMRVLDVGCGWGGLSKYLAEKHGAEVTGITISREQARLAKTLTKGLNVDIQIIDYRMLSGESYDRIVSVGMFEHVGFKNYKTYMKHMHRLLKENGIFLLHTIGSELTNYTGDPWSEKYIFPNGMLPSITQIGKSIEDKFVMEDWHNFGAYYDKTLMSWHKNFLATWPNLKNNEKYDERFFRMWEYYLLSFAGAFRSRIKIQLWQLILTKGLGGGYERVR